MKKELTQEEKLELVEKFKQQLFSSMGLALHAPDYYNVKQSDFDVDIKTRGGICEYVSIYSAYINIFPNKHSLEEIIDLTKPTDYHNLTCFDIIDHINNYLHTKSVKLYIMQNREQVNKDKKIIEKQLDNHRAIPVGYGDIDTKRKRHMVNVLGYNDKFLYYVENGDSNILYDDVKEYALLFLFMDIVNLDDIKQSIYYLPKFQKYYEILKENELFILDNQVYHRYMDEILNDLLIDKSFKHPFISSINSDIFYNVFSWYYYVLCDCYTPKLFSYTTRLDRLSFKNQKDISVKQSLTNKLTVFLRDKNIKADKSKIDCFINFIISKRK